MALFFLGIKSGNALEFNIDMLDTEDSQHIDLSRFSQAGYVMPGRYQLTLKVNDQEVSREISVPFYSRQSGNEMVSEACISPELREKIGLKEKFLNRTGLWHEEQCVDFSDLKGVKLSTDLSESQLNMTIPQLYLEYSDASWLPPSRWDNGIPGFLVDYNLNASVNKSHGNSQNQSAWLNGTMGANYGAWRLRGDYQGNYSHKTGGAGQKDASLQWSRVYMYRALPSWRASLTLGESTFNSELFSGWSYSGLSLTSDERQLPPKLRGYAPQISGVADTNARVTVTQQGHMLYDTTVPAGPFSIQDIGSSIRGTLDVKVTEQDGRVKTFQVNAAYVPYLTRPGQIRYKLISGRSRQNFHRTEGPIFAAGELSYGLSNRWSLYAGGVIAGNYNAAALGAGIDLGKFGTLSADVTQSIARVARRGEKAGKETQQGKSWRISYSKRFDDINTDVTFAGYRFSERHYMTMQQYLDANYRDNWDGRSKEAYTLSLYKNFPEQQFSMGLSYNHQTFWDRGETTYYNIRADKYFSAFGMNNISVGVGANRSRYTDTGKMDNSVSLNLSLPLGKGSLNYGSSYSGDRLSHNVGLHGLAGERDNYSLQVGMDHGRGERSRAQFNGYYSHMADIAHTSVNISMAQGSNFSVGMSASGGATITSKGAALQAGGFSGGTRLMVDTDGVANVPVDGGQVRTNRWGIGVVTDVSSYYRNTVMVDVNKLDSDVEARGSVAESVLTEGAIGYHKFEVLKGSRLFVVLRLEDNSSPPFGASVRNEKGRELGIVSDGGVAWVSGAQPEETLQVGWNDQYCTVRLPARIDSLSQVLLPCQVNVAQ
ncbi:fimbria/pilus outer membrane usher protein [Xenorhabdus sp. VLS]|uniref:Fimbria/pilus outer membrane usher protein n=2 Tax=Xenorhabdus lircayensis TaxID=2763499 RepID=A0ABS0U8Q0_9GAMM|nr:fimbria/pilus outer membrane usher protein [Xenorhabdus lircayensis]